MVTWPAVFGLDALDRARTIVLRGKDLFSLDPNLLVVRFQSEQMIKMEQRAEIVLPSHTLFSSLLMPSGKRQSGEDKIVRVAQPQLDVQGLK